MTQNDVYFQELPPETVSFSARSPLGRNGGEVVAWIQ